jgi:hypothetical protein
MSLIDLSAATPATRDHIAEKQFGERLQQTALAQMLDAINQGKSDLNPIQREAIEMFQTEGIAVAIEFIAQQCNAQDNDLIKLLRTQIIDANIRRVKAAEGRNQESAVSADPTDDDALIEKQLSPNGYIQIAVGYSPEATSENAHAVLTALLLAFIQVAQKFPSAVVEAEAARIALQWIPTEDESEGDRDSTAV